MFVNAMIANVSDKGRSRRRANRGNIGRELRNLKSQELFGGEREEPIVNISALFDCPIPLAVS